MKNGPAIFGLITLGMLSVCVSAQAKVDFLRHQLERAEKVPITVLCRDYKKHLKLTAVDGMEFFTLYLSSFDLSLTNKAADAVKAQNKRRKQYKKNFTTAMKMAAQLSTIYNTLCKH